MDEKKAKRFVSFLKNKYGEDGAKKKIQKIQKTGKVDDEDLKEFQASEQKQQQAQAKKALHGAKLNYFKSLKNQCAEDEEIVYYKKGGSVSCGCKKKEQGGEVTKAGLGSVVEKFKNRAKDTLEQAKKKKELEDRYKKGQVRVGKDLSRGTNNVTKEERRDVTKEKCGSKIKKHQNGSVIAQFKADRRMKRISF